MRRFAKCAWLILTLLILGCEEWPPYESEIKNHFNTNRTEMELLRDKLLSSKYLSVGDSWATHAWGSYYEGELTDGTVERTERPTDEAKWVELLRRAEIDQVSRDDYDSTTVSLSKFYYSGKLGENIAWQMRYVHDPGLPAKVRECGKTNPDVRCGSCLSTIGDGWYLQYWWRPDQYLPELEEAHLNNEVSDAEYYEKIFRAEQACFAEGGMFLVN